jgi:hypothetical protein
MILIFAVEMQQTAVSASRGMLNSYANASEWLADAVNRQPELSPISKRQSEIENFKAGTFSALQGLCVRLVPESIEVDILRATQ